MFGFQHICYMLFWQTIHLSLDTWAIEDIIFSICLTTALLHYTHAEGILHEVHWTYGTIKSFGPQRGLTTLEISSRANT